MAQRRTGRWLLFLTLFILFGGAVFLRIHRHAFDKPTEVHVSLFRVHNAFVDFYAARHGGRILLFDAGVDTDGNALDAVLHALGATRDDVSDIFFTHGHGDHLGAALLCRNARLHAGAADADFISGEKSPSFLSRPMSWVLPPPRFKITDSLTGRIALPVGGDKSVLAIPLPGHTPGSYAYLFDDVLFVGDSLNFDGTTLTAASRFFSIDPDENRRQVSTLRSLVGGPKIDTVCTGHGGCTPPAETNRLIDEVMEHSR